MNKRHVIIIGAGMAGLMAAKELLEHGYAVTLLEARIRIGGRVHTLHAAKTGMVIEGGAEFIHGNPPLSLHLLNEFHIPYHKTGGKMISISGGILNKQDEQVKGWPELMEQMANVKTDLAFSDFLNRHFSDDRYAGLRASAIGFAAGFDLADPDKASTKYLFKEWNEEEDGQFRIGPGYTALVDALAESCIAMGCKIETGCVAREILWQKKQVSATDGRIFNADKILITVPLSMLDERTTKKGLLIFSPAVPAISAAAAKIGFGAVIKVLLLFNKNFWNDYADRAGFFFTPGVFPTWWTQFPEPGGLLTGWLGGVPSSIWAEKPESVILGEALRSLQLGFDIEAGILKNNLMEFHIFNWQDEDFSCGAYSYALPDTSDALKTLSMPVDHTVYFAGEAVYQGKYPGTVEAALVSGLDAAKRIQDADNKLAN